jgi:hypothetical protein
MISQLHERALTAADRAEVLIRREEPAAARRMYAIAAALEHAAWSDVPAEKARTRSILAVSAAWLYYRSDNPDRGRQAVIDFLLTGGLQRAARRELRQVAQLLLPYIRREADLSPTASRVEILDAVAEGFGIDVQKLSRFFAATKRTLELRLSLNRLVAEEVLRSVYLECFRRRRAIVNPYGWLLIESFRAAELRRTRELASTTNDIERLAESDDDDLADSLGEEG